MRKVAYLIAVAMAMAGVPRSHARSAESPSNLQEVLNQKFVLTKITSDKSDIVTAGAVVVLQKDGMMMYSTASPMPASNNYKKGKISQGGSGFGRDLLITMMAPGAATASSYPQRKFVAGEKVWVTKFSVEKDSFHFVLFSDPIGDLRYYGELKVPFSKGPAPTADAALQMISEVLTVDNSAGASPPEQKTVPVQTAQLTAADQPLSAIAPPPPPPATGASAPTLIALGQTRADVIASLGEPDRTTSGQGTEKLFYPKMTVTLVNGKVTDVD